MIPSSSLLYTCVVNTSFKQQSLICTVALSTINKHKRALVFFRCLYICVQIDVLPRRDVSHAPLGRVNNQFASWSTCFAQTISHPASFCTQHSIIDSHYHANSFRLELREARRWGGQEQLPHRVLRLRFRHRITPVYHYIHLGNFRWSRSARLRFCIPQNSQR